MANKKDDLTESQKYRLLDLTDDLVRAGGVMREIGYFIMREIEEENSPLMINNHLEGLVHDVGSIRKAVKDILSNKRR